MAAQALKITARDMKDLKLIDDIVPEPQGGAHLDHDTAAQLLSSALSKQLGELKNMPVEQLLSSRYDKFRHMGQYFTE